MTVKVVGCPDSAQMMDSDAGGLIGLAVRATRASTMRKVMAGTKGDMVRELARQNVSKKMEGAFDVVDDNAKLTTEINIMQWGWFVPSTLMGIKTGSYQMRVNGDIKVYDTSLPKKKCIAYAISISDQPLGNDPTPDVAQEALIKAVNEFSANASMYLLSRQPAK